MNITVKAYNSNSEKEIIAVEKYIDLETDGIRLSITANEDGSISIQTMTKRLSGDRAIICTQSGDSFDVDTTGNMIYNLRGK